MVAKVKISSCHLGDRTAARCGSANVVLAHTRYVPGEASS